MVDMKKVSLLILCLIISFLPCDAETVSSEDLETQPKVFIYHIPDETSVKDAFTPSDEVRENNEEKTSTDITSDDVTADTSGTITEEEPEEEIITDYDIDDMYTDVLQGYAVYDEDEDTISLEDNLDEFQTIKIQRPAKIKGGKYVAAKTTAPNTYSKFSNMEYSIAPISSTNYRSKGGFSAGTMFNQGIDYAELESSTGVFSRYDSKYFAVSTAYAKTVNSTNNNYNDNFYFSPELKLNQYFTLREILSADIAKNRKKAEVVLSINPFGKKDFDRLRFELGASTTLNENNETLKNQFKFSTKFKL